MLSTRRSDKSQIPNFIKISLFKLPRLLFKCPKYIYIYIYIIYFYPKDNISLHPVAIPKLILYSIRQQLRSTKHNMMVGEPKQKLPTSMSTTKIAKWELIQFFFLVKIYFQSKYFGSIFVLVLKFLNISFQSLSLCFFMKTPSKYRDEFFAFYY